MRSLSGRFLRVACIASSLVMSVPASAQNERLGTYMEGKRQHDWSLKINILIQSYQGWTGEYERSVPSIEYFSFENARVVLPIAPRTASSETDVKRTVAKLTIDDREVDSSPTFLDGYQGGTRLVALDAVNAKCRQVSMETTLRVRCWETVFDDVGARAVKWPDQWPAEAQSTFEPMAYVDSEPGGARYDMKPIKDWVLAETGGDPRSQPPVVTAKWLAGRLAEKVQPSGEGLVWSTRGGMWEGFDPQPLPDVLRKGRGSELDLTLLLCAVYREAGLPTRIVVGFDARGDREEQIFLQIKKGDKQIRTWVEFCLYDQATKETTWVPVDIVALRKNASRLPKNFMERPLKYFGTHEDLWHIVPICFHLHPPTTVRAYGSPGMWGWFVTPAAPDRAYQGIRLDVSSASRTAEDQKKDRNNQRGR